VIIDYNCHYLNNKTINRTQNKVNNYLFFLSLGLSIAEESLKSFKKPFGWICFETLAAEFEQSSNTSDKPYRKSSPNEVSDDVDE
jgi:hypothetical protein